MQLHESLQKRKQSNETAFNFFQFYVDAFLCYTVSFYFSGNYFIFLTSERKFSIMLASISSNLFPLYGAVQHFFYAAENVPDVADRFDHRAWMMGVVACVGLTHKILPIDWRVLQAAIAAVLCSANMMESFVILSWTQYPSLMQRSTWWLTVGKSHVTREDDLRRDSVIDFWHICIWKRHHFGYRHFKFASAPYLQKSTRKQSKNVLLTPLSWWKVARLMIVATPWLETLHHIRLWYVPGYFVSMT